MSGPKARAVLNAPRLRPSDAVRLGAGGLRTRPLRVILSALGIAIGIAAMVAVVGISASSRAKLDRELAALGTNLLSVTPGQTMSGDATELPKESTAMVRRIGPVTDVSATGTVDDAHVYRNDHMPENQTGGMAVRAADLNLLKTVGGKVADGTWLNAATARYPAIVLGAAAAKRLGITDAQGGSQVWVGGRWFTVVGILDPVVLWPELDSAVLVGWQAAVDYLKFDGHPSTVFTRTTDAAVEAVRSVLARTANPQAPNEVQVSRPSEALAARQATNRTFDSLLLALGTVALVVGGIGVANTMVISVLERRVEIGLRRALGATKGQVRLQFVVESWLLSLLGGVAGVTLGAAVTSVYAGLQGWPVVIPSWVMASGIGATLVIGGVAGVYPAMRAARMSPTEALAAT